MVLQESSEIWKSRLFNAAAAVALFGGFLFLGLALVWTRAAFDCFSTGLGFMFGAYALHSVAESTDIKRMLRNRGFQV